MKNVPSAVWYCITVCFLAVVAAFVVLSNNGSDPTEFRSFLNTVLNFAATVLSGGTLLFAGVAAKNSQDVKRATNGELDKRIQDGATAALIKHGKGGGDDGRSTV